MQTGSVFEKGSGVIRDVPESDRLEHGVEKSGTNTASTVDDDAFLR